MRLLVFGLGYTGSAIARAAAAEGFAVSGTVRDAIEAADDGIVRVNFLHADDAIAASTHVVCAAPPGPSGDPVLSRYAAAIAAAPRLRWIGYLSTTGVYGDRNGGWVDEATAPAPRSDRSR